MNRYDPAKHHRRSIRLKGYDYSSAGCYFVTICVADGVCSLGDIVDGEMVYSDYGRIAAESWLWLAEQYDYVSLDEWMIMPNHMHGIPVYDDDEMKGGGGVFGEDGLWEGGSGEGGSGEGGSRTAPRW